MAAADRLSLGPEVRKLKLGESFSKNGTKNFHTFRYDFKPASMDTKKVATVEIGPNNQATVTVPHVEGAGTAHTVFKGSRKPYTKECVLIIDHTTGEIVLEKLHSNVQLKKTRTEGTARRPLPGPAAPAQATGSGNQQQQQLRPHTPVLDQQSNFGPSSKRTSPSRKPSHSPVQQQQQQQRTTSSPSSPSMSNLMAPPTGLKSLASSFVPSMPLLLDGGDQGTSSTRTEPSDATSEVGFLSDSSNDESSSSGSSSGSSSDASDDEGKGMKSGKKPAAPIEAAPPMISQQSSSNSFPSMPHFSQLTEDLHLSESGSDSDG